MYKAPFGSDSARFTTVGVHPNLLATGRMPYDSQLNTETVIVYSNLTLKF